MARFLVRLYRVFLPSLLIIVWVIQPIQEIIIPVPERAAASSPTPIVIVPDQMQFSGDVATRANSAGTCSAPWFEGTPEGTIILGVNPNDCVSNHWKGGSAAVQITLLDDFNPTVYLLHISWLDRDGKGLHSPDKNHTATITLDDKPLWAKRTVLQGTFNDYYAAQHEPIQTTLVVSGTNVHTLTFEVPEHTAWDISEITLSASSSPTLLKGVGYSPYRDCQYPGGQSLPSTENIQEDMFRLANISNAIRTYSSIAPNDQVPAIAYANGLSVFPGAWLDQPKTTLAQDDIETSGLIQIAQTTPVEGVIVGNEYYLRHRNQAALDYLLDRIRQVKNAAHIPVTTAEIDELMFDFSGSSPKIRPEYRPILDELDYVMIHIYPFWGGLPVQGAAEYTIQHYTAIRNLLKQQYPPEGKRLIIGEAGWPSGGARNGRAAVSKAIQRAYLLEFLRLADQEQVEFLYFDAFDELWKIEEPGGVGQHWGFAYTDRTAKLDFFGVLFPPDVLPLANTANFTDLFLPLVNDGIGTRRFPVYTEWPEGPGRFVPSGWMGDIDKVSLYGCDRQFPHSGEMAIRASFMPGGEKGWGGVLWQYPENNWGDLPGALDLRWANKVTFWSRGQSGGEKVRFFIGGVGSQDDPYHDSLRPEITTGFIELEKDWQKYTINLSGKDLSNMIGGFGWATDQCANPFGAVFYLDDINYEYDPTLQPLSPPGPIFDIYTDAAAPDNHYYPSGWMGDAEQPGHLSLTECWLANPHSGDTSIRIAYTQPIIGWAAVYWLSPADNWGDRPGGYDLRGARRITFWARTDTPGTRVKFLIGGIGYETDYKGQAICSDPIFQYPDSICPKIEKWITLSTEWTQYSIDLDINSSDLSHVVGAFGWMADSPLVFYLDDIVYEFAP